MVLQSKAEGASARSGIYVGELQEFFRSRAIHFGTAGDLIAFAALVDVPGPFQEEMGSLVRSILFQEDGTADRVELLELLTRAAGGPEIKTGTQEVQTAIRQIASFVNEALRQGSRMMLPELQGEEEEVTAGDVLAAATAQEGSGGRTVSSRSPEKGLYGRGGDPLDQPASTVGGRGAPRDEPAGGGMLFRAVSMSDEEAADAGLQHWEGKRRRWLIPAVLAGVIALVMGGYLARPLLDHSRALGTGLSGTAQVRPELAPGSCAGPAASGTLRSSLAQRSMWAHRLLDQRLYAAALPELQSIAQADPGFPGVYLDESEALLHLKRPEDAREAVDTQIGISECMVKLPSPALDTYCSAEFAAGAAATCRPELARIREAAQLQAAMVHLELGHRFEPEGAATDLTKEDAPARNSSAGGALSSPGARARRVAPLPAASEGDNERAGSRAVASGRPAPGVKTSRKTQSDDSLVKGDGTDLSLGAYSKPQ